jgi:nitrous oxide reductase
MSMPHLDHHEPSRRSVLRVAAGAGAAGIAATTLGGALTAASAATRQRAAADTSTASTAHDVDSAGDVVLHVRDAAAGDIDVFRGTTQIRLRDRDLAARVVRASR